MSKIKKDIKKDIDPQSVKKQDKSRTKDVLWVVKCVVLFIILQLLGQILYALCFTLSIPEARQSMEIFQNVIFSTIVINQSYYFGHVFVLLCLIIKAITNASGNKELGKTLLEKFCIETECKSLKNVFHGINYFSVGLAMQSVLTTLVSLFSIMVLGREMPSMENYFSISPYSLLVIGICIPLAEELLFRGKILRRITQHFDEKKANQIQALGYAVIHGISAYSASDYIMGLLFGRMKRMSGSIIAPLLAHIGANTLNALLFTFPNLLSYRLFSIIYCIVLTYGAGVILFVLFKSVWNNTKK